jgi:hypothetical protein
MNRLNESQLRTAAAANGYPVSGRQLRDFQRWGLIPASDAQGTWSGETVDTLMQIRVMGDSVRSLPRRVLLLRCEGLSVPGSHLRDAMAEVAPTIRQPVGKMRRLLRARRLLSEPVAARLTDAEWRAWEEQLGKTPEPRQWPRILSQAAPAWIERRFTDRWFLSTLWMRERCRDTPYDISDIPLDEVLTMLAVLDISAAQTRWGNPGGISVEATN